MVVAVQVEGEEWGQEGGSGRRWEEVGGSGRKWEEAGGSGRKWEEVGGRRWLERTPKPTTTTTTSKQKNNNHGNGRQCRRQRTTSHPRTTECRQRMVHSRPKGEKVQRAACGVVGVRACVWVCGRGGREGCNKRGKPPLQILMGSSTVQKVQHTSLKRTKRQSKSCKPHRKGRESRGERDRRAQEDTGGGGKEGEGWGREGGHAEKKTRSHTILEYQRELRTYFCASSFSILQLPSPNSRQRLSHSLGLDRSRWPLG